MRVAANKGQIAATLSRRYLAEIAATRCGRYLAEIAAILILAANKG